MLDPSDCAGVGAAAPLGVPPAPPAAARRVLPPAPVPGLPPACGMVTLAPSRSRSAPSTTTWSPTRQARQDRDALALNGPELDFGHRDLVVGIDQIDKGAGRAALHRRGRRDHDVLERVDQQLGVDELLGEQLEIVVVELRLAA